NSARDYDEEESNDEEYNSKYDFSTEIDPDLEEGDTWKIEAAKAKNNPTVQPPLKQRERPRPFIHQHHPHLPGTHHLLALLQTATRPTLLTALLSRKHLRTSQ
ncbi:hypothetical protein TNCV_2409171, partial [Trichonephila clavipes]